MHIRIFLLTLLLFPAAAHAQDCAAIRTQAEAAIKAANRCTTDADCGMLDMGCPWGNTNCDIILGHKDALAKAHSTADLYRACASADTALSADIAKCNDARTTATDCILNFDPQKGFRCVESICVPYIPFPGQ